MAYPRFCPYPSCQRNFVRRYASLRRVNATDLGSVSGASDVIADHYIFAIFVAVDLHERPGSPRNPIAILFIFRIVKPGTSSRTRGRIGRRKLHSKQHKSRGLPEIFRSFIYIFIAKAKKKMAMFYLMPETELRSFTFSQRNAQNFDTSDLLPWTSSK